MSFKKFKPLQVSSKFAICGLPLRADTYKRCTFGCIYCFANYRNIMPTSRDLQIADLAWVERKLDRVYSGNYQKDNFLDMLIVDRLTWHCGGMSDPFQPIEGRLGTTEKFVDIANKYNVTILFSTKSDTVFGADMDPNLHSFQLSITNIEDRTDIEPNVSLIEKRYKFYRYLKDNNFKVGIRLQPFIPKISSADIVEMFRDADYFSIEGLKLVPQNLEQIDSLCSLLQLKRSSFIQRGLLNLKPEIREVIYRPIVKALKYYRIPFSLADNDTHHTTSSRCCCGEPLIKKSTNFNNTALYYKNKQYTLDDLLGAVGKYAKCKANHLFASNRTEGCITVEDFMRKRFCRNSAPMSNKFAYNNSQQRFDFWFESINI